MTANKLNLISETDRSKTTRRNFLKTMGFVSIGFPLFGNFMSVGGMETVTNSGRTLPDPAQVNAWLQILENSRVRVLTGKIELGQGLQTAIMQVAAEELDMDMKLVEIVIADTALTPDEGYTAGSRSMETSAMSVRYAAATAREKILELAALKFNQKPESLYFRDGVIFSHSDKKMTLNELLEGRQIEDEVEPNVKLKNKKDYRFVGKSVPRRDIEMMVKGEAVYVHDLRFPDMVHARVVRPEGYNSKLLEYDKEKVLSLPGVIEVVENGSFLGVIAHEEYQAIKAREFVKANSKWSPSEKLPAGRPLREYIKSLPADPSTDKKVGKLVFSNNEKLHHKAEYFKPYIMHASNGPSCAVALFSNDKLNIWSHSQGVYPLRRTISAMLGIPEENIEIKGVPGAGCYGHNGADDVAAEAALMARAFPGRHVRLQWMRDDEHGWEPYGSAMVMELEAGLDEHGMIDSWKYDLWSDGHSTRPGGNPENLLPARYLENGFGAPSGAFRGGAIRNAEPYYRIPNLELNSHLFQGPLRVSALRSLGAYANIFAIESFMDELAVKAGKDALTFRISHSTDTRAIACMEKLREMTKRINPGDAEGMGYAFSRYKNTAAYCAVAVFVAMEGSGKAQVKKMWAVVDAGEVINPDGIRNQIEGGMVQSASWTLMEEVKFDEQHVTSLNWATYPVLRYDEAPETEVELIDHPNEGPLGAGEAAQGPAAAAIANAVYHASGKRIRDLPLNSANV